MRKISELLAPLFKEAKAVECQESNNNVKNILTLEKESNRSLRKCVYIRTETFDIITEIAKLNPKMKLTVGGLVSDILMEYLKANKDEINKLYRQDRNDLIK